MNTTAPELYAPDNNDRRTAPAPVDSMSLTRMIALLRYYGARCKWPFLCFLLASVVIAVFEVTLHNIGKMALEGFLEWGMTLMIVLAPLTIYRSGARSVDVELPAKWQEKAIVLLGLFWIGAPAACLCVPLIAMWAFGVPPVNPTVLSLLSVNDVMVPDWLKSILSIGLSTYVSGVAGASFCLLLVLWLRHNTVVKTVLWTIAAGIFLTLGTGIFIGSYIVRCAWKLQEVGREVQEEVMRSSIVTAITTITVETYLFVALEMVVCAALICRCLKYRTA